MRTVQVIARIDNYVLISHLTTGKAGGLKL